MCRFGLDIGATKWMAIGEVCDVEGPARRTMAHGLIGDNPADVVTAFQRWTQASLASAQLAIGQTKGHVVERHCAFSGSVDASGVVTDWPNSQSWVGYPLGRCLFADSYEEGFIEDGGLCAAIGEHRFGVAKDYRDFLCVNLGTDIGSGLYIDGQPRDATVSSLGHVSIGGDELCSCGRMGCLQTVFSGKRYVSQGRWKRFTEPDAESDAVDSLVRLTSDVAGLLGLEAIVITGGVVGYWPGFSVELIARFEESLRGTQCAAVLSGFPHLSAAYGALALTNGAERHETGGAS